MIVAALIAAAAAAMLWQQERAVALEGAERARAQSAWILNGALDWARLILREDARAARHGGAPVDSLDEPWAQPLAEARLSSFLAADRDNNADSGPEAFISGTIEDAQSRFNLRGVVDSAGQVDAVQLAALTRLVGLAGAPGDAAARLVEALRGSAPGPVASGQAPSALRPTRWRELAWFGVDEATLARLAPYADLLPQPTPVNVNTAPREVLAAVVEPLGLGGAERIVQQRQREPFRSLAELQPLLPPGLDPEKQGLAVASQHFHVAGRLRLEQRVLEERSLLQRRDRRVDVLQRERRSYALPAR
jgi:general secretion pathway protein K